MNDLTDVQVGDYVETEWWPTFFRVQKYQPKFVVYQVERVTATTLVIVDNRRIRKSDGMELGVSNYRRLYFAKSSKERREEFVQACKTRDRYQAHSTKISDAITLNRLDYDTLRKIVKIIDAADEENEARSA